MSRFCPVCSGTGKKRVWKECPSCKGTGKKMGINCPLCAGTGLFPKGVKDCETCHGSGRVKDDR